MENDGISNSTHLRVASFSCYLKPYEDRLNHFGFEKSLGMETGKRVPFKRFFHGFRILGGCGTKGDQFAFPVLSPNLDILTDKEKQFEEASRNEVFGSERKLSVLTWDAIPKANDELMSVTYDDVASDTSSDLFEIETLSRTASFSESSSAFDEKKTDYTTSNRQSTAKNQNGMQKRAKKTGASGLLWCKNHQSVKVAEPVCKTTNKSKHRLWVPFT